MLVAQWCLTLCNPTDYSLPGPSVHGILQARILEWVAIRFSRGFSWPQDQIQISHIMGKFFTVWAIREALYVYLKIEFVGISLAIQWLRLCTFIAGGIGLIPDWEIIPCMLHGMAQNIFLIKKKIEFVVKTFP